MAGSINVQNNTAGSRLQPEPGVGGTSTSLEQIASADCLM
jgi:hypothetical protein